MGSLRVNVVFRRRQCDKENQSWGESEVLRLRGLPYLSIEERCFRVEITSASRKAWPPFSTG
jgi:hypothetical protein